VSAPDTGQGAPQRGHIPQRDKAPLGTLKGAAARALVSKLLAGGLVEEITVSPADPHWRTDEDGTAIGLKVTPACLEAIGIEPGGAADADPGDTPQAHGSEAHPAHRRSRRSLLLRVRSGRARSEPW